MTHLKENSCGCAGCYSAFAALELYAQAFESANALDKLEGFASFYGADFYGLPRNKETISLEKVDWIVPTNYGEITPIKSGDVLQWKLN